ncbi:hypothetical protein Ate02nite_66390 [Paractinoplanes tereljensis]|uniref:2TM domain-containing protein n=1 Tax=Paractinoplanes tereljensis TaxID=571912 RepID=A0A919NTZ3_9ACTN|nr:hypothetical protein Ate02nite_66390 [Actinoplanes tereljensis]
MSDNELRWGVRIHAFWYVVANIAQVIVWWFATPDLYFWPVWSILGWGIGLVIHIWAVRTVLSRHATT